MQMKCSQVKKLETMVPKMEGLKKAKKEMKAASKKKSPTPEKEEMVTKVKVQPFGAGKKDEDDGKKALDKVSSKEIPPKILYNLSGN